MDTHWSRILYHDLFSDPADRGARSPDAPTDEDSRSPASEPGLRRPRGPLEAMAIAPDVYRGDADSSPGRSPIGAAVILLGVSIATYLAVAGLVRVLSGPDKTSAVVRPTGVTANQSANSERAAFVLRS